MHSLTTHKHVRGGDMTIRTRFAPSPTGLLHVGGARTALFNYLFARHHGGEYLLRIEDTDRARSTPEAVQVILDGLDWLGLSPDQEPVFQSTRETRHTEVAHSLLERGMAYRCFLSPEELQAQRDQAAADKRPLRIVSPWRDRDLSEAPSGIAPVIRLRVPQEGETVVDDLVQGPVRVANAELDDMIILRSDGTPTYLHAVVVDDHDMAITHVIRGDDHLTNTFRQVQIFKALGWDLPRFAHIPLIHGADGAKLSKRHGAVSVLEFEREGFLPEALCNYLLRLGWGHGDAEILSRDEQVALFDLDGVGRAASRMDYAKLTHLNGVYLREADDQRLTTDLCRRLDLSPDSDASERIMRLMPKLKERARTLVDLAESARFIIERPSGPKDAKAAALLSDEARGWLRALLPQLQATDFSAAAVDQALRTFAEEHGLKLGQIAQPLRVALTGGTTSPPIDATLEALGASEVTSRIEAV
ncbi:Glutamyl-tRNA synthetase [Granulibacter bethesdensis]|uniref:Glutamate--tRNA ligase n=2 Tax=Granulibacter bethesdensis TaxID=364410 RepID=A0AAN0RD05_9PROT|nr:Glutamyl-tRNA synthetase [Granulibacter bethesdensis]AHJ66801.1 Glutamyl-tRNA synthetase [Granulibacter bethesdensis CGDNIH4]